MTHDDFRDWLKHHLSRFTGVGSWLASFPTEPSGVKATQAEVRTAWFDCLRKTDLVDAKAATDLLFSGDEKFPDGIGFDAHPQTVRRVAIRCARFRKPLTSTVKNHWRDETYKCILCWDTGVVRVWHPETVRHARADREGWLQTGSVYDCIVACTCESGERWAEKFKDEESRRHGLRPMLRYHEATMPPFPDPFGLSDGKQNLIAWLDEFGHLAYQQQAEMEFT